MNILLVNGSPKPVNSVSGSILDTLRAELGDAHRFTETKPQSGRTATPDFLEQDAIVIAFPLYIDALPSQLLEWLISFEALSTPADPDRSQGQAPAVFAICNCGFHEGIQTRSALRIVRNFALKNGFSWGGGLGIGSGGMVTMLEKVPERARIKREVSAGLHWVARRIEKRAVTDRAALPMNEESLGDSLRFASHAFPRFAYILAAHAGWRSMARTNGVTARGMRARPAAG
jgi:hypothetical protein